MLEDADRLLGTVEQVLKAGEVGYKRQASTAPKPISASWCASAWTWRARATIFSPRRCTSRARRTASRINVKADPEELRTAVSNILDNAIKYSDGNVDVSVQVETPDEKRVVLRVRDRGVGIPPIRTEAHLQALLSRAGPIPCRR